MDNASHLSMPSQLPAYALLGLVFHSVNLDQAKQLIRNAIQSKQQLIIATPNVNFVAMAAQDESFRQTILNCGLSLADGTPIYWIAKLLSIPLPERVAGSSLIDSLINDKDQRPIKAFFFGGQDDTAQIASQKLNAAKRGMISVGAINPGFGNIESMSSTDIIQQINDADPDFLIVSLGAKKGHQWIEANKHQLNAPVISHLGAVVNFVAGTQQRSPELLQKLGLEWLWRIYQEPALYKRYALDAITLFQKLLTCVVPALIHRYRYSTLPMQIDYQSTPEGAKITIAGSLQEPLEQKLFDHINSADNNYTTIDLQNTRYVGSQFAAIVLKKLTCNQPEHKPHLELINTQPAVAAMLRCYDVNLATK